MSAKNEKGKGRGQPATMNKPPTKGNIGNANGSKSNESATNNSQANSTQQSSNANNAPSKSWASMASASQVKQATAPVTPKTVNVDLKGATSAPPTKETHDLTSNSQITSKNTAPVKQSTTTVAPNTTINNKDHSDSKPNTSATTTGANPASNITQANHQNDKEKATNALPNGTNPSASANYNESTNTSNPGFSSPPPKTGSFSNLKNTPTVSPSTLNVKAPSFKPGGSSGSSGNPQVPQRTHSAPPTLEEQQQQYGNGMNPNVPNFSPGYYYPAPQFTPQKTFYYGYPPYIPNHSSSPLFVPQISTNTGNNPNIVPPSQMQSSMGPVPLGNNTGNFNTGINPTAYSPRYTAPVPAPAPVPVPVPTATLPVTTPTKRIAIIDPATGKEVSGSSPPKSRPPTTTVIPTPNTTTNSTPTTTPNSQFAPTVVPSPTTSNIQKSVTGPGGILPELGTMHQNKELKDEKVEKVEKVEKDKVEDKSKVIEKPKEVKTETPIEVKKPLTPEPKKEDNEEEDDWENKKEEDLKPSDQITEQKSTSSNIEELSIKAIVYSNTSMWSPSNTNGLKVYDRLFMEQFKDISSLKDKPDDMVNMDDFMDDGEPSKEREYKDREPRRDGGGQWKSQAPPGFSPRDKDRKVSRSDSGRINKDGSVSSPSSRRGGRGGGRGGMQSPMNKNKSSSNLNSNLPPVAPLERGENRWQASREKDTVNDDVTILRKVTSILNKITEKHSKHLVLNY